MSEEIINKYVAAIEQRLRDLGLPVREVQTAEEMLTFFRSLTAPSTDDDRQARDLKYKARPYYTALKHAEKARETLKSGDEDEYLKHLEQMIALNNLAQIPDLDSCLQSLRAKGKRVRFLQARQVAREIFKANPDITIDAMMEALRARRVTEKPGRSAVGAWMKEWRERKSS